MSQEPLPSYSLTAIGASLNEAEQDICYVIGTVLAFGIGIFNVTTPSILSKSKKTKAKK